ncbi:MAG TPA: Rrf2 family transcriptional regulator [bacterium]|nr:Rrf2 family transcriptional regulator [bacterium]
MNKLLNISERVNIAIHALAYIAASDRNASVKRMAKDLKVSETYLAKVLQPLVKEKLLHSKRGARGGFTLAKKPSDITAYDLVTIIEGPLPTNTCLFLEPICHDEHCRFRSLTGEVRALLEVSLRKIRVSDIMKNFEELKK